MPAAVAQEGSGNTTAIANPQAVSSGSVTNQAVQVLQGPYPIATFGMGVSCPGPALTIAPFVTGNMNNSTDPFSYQTNNGSAGFTVGFSTPLNGTITETCLEAARTTIERNQAEEAKARLDFELVRALRCGEMKRNGIHFHPNSPYAAVCADIVVINTTNEQIRNETPVSESERSKVPAADPRQVN